MSIPQQHPPLTADQAAATLGTATNLQDQLLQMHHPQAQPDPAITQDSAPQSEEKPEADNSATEEKTPEKDPMKEMELMFTTKLDEIRQELKKDNQREIDTLKKTITDALAEDEPHET